MGLFDFLQGAGSIYGTNEGIQAQRELGTQAMQRAETAATDIAQQTQFKPFTLTSAIGGATTTPEGGLGFMLSPEQQALQQQLTGLGTSSLSFVGDPASREAEQNAIISMLTQGGGGAREAEIMQRLQAAVSPEQERQRMALEERLLGQGRLGVTTSQYGGTPEQLALEKAIAEQQAGLGVSAMEQARAEQQQQASQTLAGLQETRARLGLLGDLGLQSLGASYLPQEQLLRTLQPAIDVANLTNLGQRQGAQLGSSLLQSGLTGQLGAETAATNLEQQRIQAITNLLAGQLGSDGQVTQTGLLQGILGSINNQQGATTPTSTGAAQDFFQAALDQGYFGSLG